MTLQILRGVSTYRLMLYYLAAVFVAAIACAAFGAAPYRPIDMAFSALVILAACFGVNGVFAACFGAKSNPESVCITALILALITTPFVYTDIAAIGFAIFAAAWAVASKFMLAPGRRHVFNPAAFGVALAGLVLHKTVSWWIGDLAILLPLIAAGGALILTRLRYLDLIGAFCVAVLAVTLYNRGLEQAPTSLSLLLLHSMFGFFVFVMLTEPRTAPMSRWRRVAYGLIVGLLFAPSTHVGDYYFTPEVALLVGNSVMFLTDVKRLRRLAGAPPAQQRGA